MPTSPASTTEPAAARDAATIRAMPETTPSRSWGARLLAVVVLAVAAWILLKVVIGIVTAVAWTVAVIVAIVAVIWAVRVLL